MKNKFIAALAIAISFSAVQANAQATTTKAVVPVKQEQAAKPAPKQMTEKKETPVKTHHAKRHAKGKKGHHAHAAQVKANFY
jgi:hypothetical protein